MWLSRFVVDVELRPRDKGFEDFKIGCDRDLVMHAN